MIKSTILSSTATDAHTKLDLQSQATTFGPQFSKSLEEFVRKEAFDGRGGKLLLEELAFVIEKARAIGIDVALRAPIPGRPVVLDRPIKW